MTNRTRVTPLHYLSAPPGSGKTRTLVEHLCLQSLSRPQFRTLTETSFLEDKYKELDNMCSPDHPLEVDYYVEYENKLEAWRNTPDNFFKGWYCNFLIVSPTLELMKQTFDNVYNFWREIAVEDGRLNSKTFLAVASLDAARKIQPSRADMKKFHTWPLSAQMFFGSPRNGLVLNSPVRFAEHFTDALAPKIVRDFRRQGALCTPLSGKSTPETVTAVLSSMYEKGAFGNFVFCTHETFASVSEKLPDEVRERTIVYFDEARSLVTGLGSMSLRLNPAQRSRLAAVFKSPKSPKTFIDAHTKDLPSTVDAPAVLPMPYWKLHVNPKWKGHLKGAKSLRTSLTKEESKVVSYILHGKEDDEFYDDSKCGVNTIRSMRMLMRLVTHSKGDLYARVRRTGTIDCYQVARPDLLFSGFHSAYLFAAYFESSQIYAMLQVSPNKGKTFTLKSLTKTDLRFLHTWPDFQTEMDMLATRAADVVIVPLTDSESLTSKEKLLTRPWFQSEETATKYLKELKLSLKQNPAMLQSLAKIEKLRLDIIRPDLRTGVSQHGEYFGLFPAFLEATVRYLKTHKVSPVITETEVSNVLRSPGAAALKIAVLKARKAFKGRALLSLNQLAATRLDVLPYLLANDSQDIIDTQSTPDSPYKAFHLLPHNPHGLNKYLACTTIAYFKSSQPCEGEATLMKILTTRPNKAGEYTRFYSATEEIPIDLAVQASTRTCLRAARSTSPIYIFVPDLMLAKLLKDRLSSDAGSPKIAGHLTDIKFEHDVYQKFKQEELAKVRTAGRPLVCSDLKTSSGETTKRYTFNENSKKCTAEFKAKVQGMLDARRRLKNNMQTQTDRALRQSSLDQITRLEAKLDNLCL